MASLPEVSPQEEVVLPVLQEFVDVQVHKNITGVVRLEKTIHQHDVLVEQDLVSESISVEHIPVNRYLDEPVATRQEGDVTIIPVMEEIVIVRKQLVLKEEIHITRQSRQSLFRETVPVRVEQIEVERRPALADPAQLALVPNQK